MYFDQKKWENDEAANFGKPFQRCSITVMDTVSDPNIVFDKDGVCNYYHTYKEKEKTIITDEAVAKKNLEAIVNKIKEEGRGKKYDCITGVSGGVDSTYLVYMAKQLGLNPLIVHFDNGWNSEIAVKNIENIISKTGFDLYTLVVDWEEFRDLQLAYFKANVVDIEALTDHAISATMYKLARKERVKYILSGNNFVTEGILPSFWIFNKSDSTNIKAIHKAHGQVKLKTFPMLSIKKRRMYQEMLGFQFIELLNYLPYNKAEVKKKIAEEFGWKDYGGKHYESIFTRFYQGYILPVKFGIDKRKAHLSTLICSGQITREEALKELETPIYDDAQLKTDKEFVLKKLGFSEADFEAYMKAPRVEHTHYKTEAGFFETYPFLKPFKNILTGLKK